MKFLFTLSLALSLFAARAQPGPQAVIDQLVNEEGIVGVAAAYAIDGTTEWSSTAGHRCKKPQILFSDTTRTRTASIAKSMTAIAAMQLAEQGQLDLDLPITEYLPAFPKKAKGTITSRHLLNHTSGLTGYQSPEEAENEVAYANLEEAMQVFANRPLLFEPGTGFFYTTYGYVVLGRIIEAVSGQSYETYMQTHIWGPSGMKHTGVEVYGEPVTDAACLYHKKRRKPKLADQNNLSNRTPGGGLYTTLEDMIRFGNAVVNHQLVKAETLEEMMSTPDIEKEGNPYGLGWFLYGPPPYEHLVIGHSGEQTGAATQLMLIPESKTVVVVLANTSGAWKAVVQAASELIRISEQ